MSKKAIIAIIVAAVVLVGGGVTAFFLLRPSEEEVKQQEIVDKHPNQAQSILTGQWMDKNVVGQRPLAIMMENEKHNHPLFGLNSSGVIYECPVEGSSTRFMVLYDNNIDDNLKLGNVRSSRPYYIYFAHEFDAIYVNWGASVRAIDLLATDYIDNISGVINAKLDTVVFFKTKDHPSPSNIYTNRGMIMQGVQQMGYRTSLDTNKPKKFTFTEEPEQVNALNVEGATDVAVIKPYFFVNLPRFEYDPATQKYKRFQFGKEQIDGNDNSQIVCDNIIFQDVDSHDLEEHDTANSPYIWCETIGKGTGKYFTKGKMIDITWSRPTENDVTKYYDLKGNEIVINQGRTWVCTTENKYKEKNKYYATVEEYNAAANSK